MNFDFCGSPARVVFGAGQIQALPDEIKRLGKSKAILLATPQQEAEAQEIADGLGLLCLGLIADARMHTPIDVTEKASAHVIKQGGDLLISYGGGSTTGLSKAIALQTGLPQIAIPTTYAGSEATPILGQTKGGLKTTLRDLAIRPDTIIYDPDLTRSLPYEMSVTSGLNAIAHAIGALYAKDRNPISSLMAVEAVRAFVQALPVIRSDLGDKRARERALYGSWLSGTVLGQVGMSLHHKLCHTLGGAFNTPHAATHAIMLPHTTAYNEVVASESLAPLNAIFDGPVGAGIYALEIALDAPRSLRELGLNEADLDHAAELALRDAYWNPRPVEGPAIRALLQDAWEGREPRP